MTAHAHIRVAVRALNAARAGLDVAKHELLDASGLVEDGLELLKFRSSVMRWREEMAQVALELAQMEFAGDAT